MLKDLIPQFRLATEEAAIASFFWIGKRNEKEADRAAVDAMRKVLNIININAKIVIGEGERDNAPMLFIGEEVGTKHGPELDIAVDPLEGTKLCANGKKNALSVLAVGKKGCLLNAPDVYMEKIAIGPNLPKNIISLDNSVQENLKNLALAKKCSIYQLKVTILDRPRHQELIAKVKESGAQLNLISDGDIAAIINLSYGVNLSDIYMGIGGAPEGVLAAASLLTVGGQMQGRLLCSSKEEEDRAKNVGIKDINKIYELEELAKGEVVCCITGVTDGNLVEGIKLKNNKFTVSSLVTYSGDKAIQRISNVIEAK